VDYFFYSEPEFLELLAAGGLLEFARVPPNGPRLYGMPAAQVVEALERGQDVVAGVSGIDVQGAASVRQRIPNAILIFLKPPDFETLERRLRQRGTESAEDMKRRLENARAELAREPEFDYTVINPDGGLEQAVDEVISIMRRERSRPSPRYAEVTRVGA
jgi:guanylate kinase